MINGLDTYYSKNIGRGLKPVSTNNKNIGRGLKPVSTNKKQHANGLKPVFNKGQGCKKFGGGLRILQ